MANSDWSQWDVGPPNSLVISNPLDGPTGGSTRSLLFEDTLVGSTEGYGYIYNGDDVGEFPSTGVIVTVVMKSIGRLAERGAHGAMFWGNVLSGTLSSSSIDCVTIGPRADGTDGGTLIRATRHNNGGFSTFNDGTELSITPVEGDWVQYQAAIMVDTNQVDITSRRIGMWARANNSGTGLSTPGSAGWTPWTLLKRVDSSSDSAMHGQLRNGVHGGFGYWISTGSSGSPSNIYWNNIAVEYGTII